MYHIFVIPLVKIMFIGAANLTQRFSETPQEELELGEIIIINSLGCFWDAILFLLNIIYMLLILSKNTTKVIILIDIILFKYFQIYCFIVTTCKST